MKLSLFSVENHPDSLPSVENRPAGKSPPLPRSSRRQGRSPALAGAERQRSALTAESRGVVFTRCRAASTIVVRHRFTPPASAIGAPVPPSRASSTASPPTSEPQELTAATLDTIRHHEYHPSARRSTPTPPEQKHEHHDSLAVSTRRLILSRPPNSTGRAVPLIFPACRAGPQVASAHGPCAKPLALASGPCHGPRVSDAARSRRGCAVPRARVSPVRFDL